MKIGTGLAFPKRRMVTDVIQSRVAARILFIRHKKVLLDSDLAELYGVEVRTLNQAVRRNAQRFPDDFMFQLTVEEMESLRSQFVILNTEGKSGSKRGIHRKYRPYVFTEQGVAMLSSVLRSNRAIRVNIAIMRTFVRLRELLASHEDLSESIKEIENRLDNNDSEIRIIFKTLQRLMSPGDKPKRRIGFCTDE